MNSDAFDFPPEESNKLFVLINRRDWNRAVATAKRSPNFAKEQCTVTGFYDGRFSSCMTAMHLACALDAPPTVIQALYEANPICAKDTESTYGRLPLHIAVMFSMSSTNLYNLVKLYPKALKTQDAHGRVPLHYACKSDSTPIDEKNALALLKADPSTVQIADFNGFLPLHVACRSLISRTVIRMLIRSAPETIVKQTAKGNTAIYCAQNSRHGNEERRQEIVGMLQRTVEEFGLTLPECS
ncbi:ankyrin repeat domain protein [Nitzschia inconspicua]|uniref:Ankyrin repeat domain protein n=1 Tax=Nitzschia inconspicua TaxID=303405 RepID=A0A9K3Q1L3_9STRA|nr:ankyrin repeat domain protein [Nitzschia inconspicua]